MFLKSKQKTQWMCDSCGAIYPNKDNFNPDDSTDDNKDYCLICHPRRMTYIQLIEWLAKGNGFLCQQAMDYCTAPTFSLSPTVRINGKSYPGTYKDQIPYNEHELIVRCFDESKNPHYWEIPTLDMYKRDVLDKR